MSFEMFTPILAHVNENEKKNKNKKNITDKKKKKKRWKNMVWGYGGQVVFATICH